MNKIANYVLFGIVFILLILLIVSRSLSDGFQNFYPMKKPQRHTGYIPQSDYRHPSYMPQSHSYFHKPLRPFHKKNITSIQQLYDILEYEDPKTLSYKYNFDEKLALELAKKALLTILEVDQIKKQMSMHELNHAEINSRLNSLDTELNFNNNSTNNNLVNLDEILLEKNSKEENNLENNLGYSLTSNLNNPNSSPVPVPVETDR